MRTPTSVLILSQVRRTARERRRAHSAYRELERELASYRTPSDVDDLLAAIDREGDSPNAALMRSILENNLAAHHRRQRLAA